MESCAHLPKSPYQARPLPCSITVLLEAIKSEVITHYLHPLENDFYDVFRNMRKNEPNPAEYFKKILGDFNATQDACRKSVSAQVAHELDLLMFTIPRGLDSGAEDALTNSDHHSEECQVPTPITVAISICSDDSDDAPAENCGSRSHTIASETVRADTECPPLFRAYAVSRLFPNNTSVGQTRNITSPFEQRRNSKRTREPPSPPSDRIESTSASASKRVKPSTANTKEPLDYLVTKRTIFTSELMENECVHHFGQHKGLYVLRCNVTACKVKLQPYRDQLAYSSTEGTSGINDVKNAALYFTADPLCNDRAIIHFGSRGHGLSNKREIYKKYGVRVLDATEEQNLGSSKDRSSCIRLGFSNSAQDEGEIEILSETNVGSLPVLPSRCAWRRSTRI